MNSPEPFEPQWAKPRSATDADFPAIARLLGQSQLPTADLSLSALEFIVITDANLTSATALVGTGALERFGEVAQLRSLAVDEQHRGVGLGKQIVEELERRAVALGVRELFLLTETAEQYFSRLGFQVIDRALAPPDIRTTAAFRSLCPASATCMAKRIPSNP